MHVLTGATMSNGAVVVPTRRSGPLPPKNLD